MKQQPDGTTVTFPTDANGHEFSPIELTIPRIGEEMRPEILDEADGGKKFNSLPPELTDLKNQEIEEGESVEFCVEVTGAPQPEVSWYKDKHPITDEPHRRFLATRQDKLCILKIVDARCGDQGTYMCKAYNNAGEAIRSCELLVNKITPTVPPEFTKGLKDIHIIEGSSTRFDVKIKASPEPVVQWHKDGKAIEQSDRITIVHDDDTSALIVKYGKLEDAGEYRCVAVNEGGKAECKGNLIVSPVKIPPLFIEPLKDVQVKEDHPATLNCRVTGKPDPEITWYKDDSIIEADDRHEIKLDFDNLCVLMILKTNLDDEGTYKCEAKNECGLDSTSAGLAVDGEGRSPDFTKVLSNIEIPEDSPVRLEVRVDGKPTPKVEWFKDGKQLKAAGHYEITKDGNSRSVVIHKCRHEDEGTYLCKAFNKFGATSCEAQLTIAPDTVPPRFTQKLFDISVDEGDNIIFSVKYVGTPEPEVSWFLDSDRLSEDDGVYIETEPGVSHLIMEDVAPSDAGNYKCVIVNTVNKATTNAELIVMEKEVKVPHEKPITNETEMASTEEHNGYSPKFVEKLLDKEVTNGDPVQLQVCFWCFFFGWYLKELALI